jgi:hypothetical protein
MFKYFQVTLSIFLIFSSLNTVGQAGMADSNGKGSIGVNYYPPDSGNDGCEAHVNINFTIVELNGTLQIKLSASTKATSLYQYWYKGKRYTVHELGPTVFLNAEFQQPCIEFSIVHPGGKTPRLTEIPSKNTFSDLRDITEHIKPSDFRKNPSGFALYSVIVKYVYPTTKSNENFLKAIINYENNHKFNDKISEADNLFKSKKYLEAKKLYEEANRIKSEDPYPNQKINEIKEILRIEQEQKISEAKNKTKESGNHNSSSTIPSGESHNQSNNYNKQSTTEIQNQQIKNQHLPSIVKTTDGKIYRKDEFGNLKQITGDEYDRMKAEEYKKKEEEQKRNKEEAIRDQLAAMEAQNRKNAESAARISQGVYTASTTLINSYYAGMAMQEMKNNIDRNTKMHGNYNSVEELNAAFYQQMENIRIENKNVTQAGLQASYAYNQALFQNKETSDLINGIGTMIANSAEAKREKEAYLKLEMERERAYGEMMRKKHEALVNMRIKLMEEFPDGGFPAESHKITQNEIFFFAYIIDKKSTNDQSPNIFISNVFSIKKYADGSWPLKSLLMKEISKLGAGSPILMGYYTNEKLAKDMQSTFSSLSGQSGMKVIKIEHKIPENKNSGNGAVDFWGNPIIQPKNVAQPLENNKNNSSYWD